jgi:glycogen debranching enzyme
MIPGMVFGPDECENLDRLQQREWLETDGLGNWAAGTIGLIHTRRFHGWLVAEDARRTDFRLLLAKCEETVFARGERHELGANLYPDTVHPQGYRFLVEFRLDPWPVWTYQVDDIVLERHLVLLHGAATTVVIYRVVEADAPVALELRPLVSGRAVRATAVESVAFNRRCRTSGEHLEMAPYGPGSRVVLTYPRGRFLADGFWYYNFLYARDLEEGLAGREDLYNPGLILFTLAAGDQRLLAVSNGPLDGLDLDAALNGERTRRAALITRAGAQEPLAQRLAVSADAYRISRRGRSSLVPRFPGTGPDPTASLWGLPGLTLATGHRRHARETLLTLAPLLPEFEPEAGLWFAWALGWWCVGGGTPNHLVTDVAEAIDRAADIAPWRLGLHALWHHALVLLARLTGDASIEIEAARAATAFRERHLATDSASCGPEWLLAIALEPELLPLGTALDWLHTVGEQLVGPLGLRDWPGGELQRPAWLGLYADSLLRLAPDGAQRVAELLAPFAEPLRQHALGQVAEAYDEAGNPHGALGHAAAVGELLRTAWQLGWTRPAEDGPDSILPM